MQKLGGEWLHEITRVGQTVWARLMQSQIWYLPASSVGEGLRKATMASASTYVWEKAAPQLLPWCQTTQLFLICLCCLLTCFPGSGAQSNSVWVSLYTGSLRGTAKESSISIFHSLILTGFYSQKLWKLLLPLETWAEGPGLWLGPHTPEISFPIFMYLTWVWDQHIPCVHPSFQSGCCFLFNSVVVGLRFSSISNSSEWWLFYSLVVILMWLCKEVSPVYLRRHLDWKSND